jgi:hypothetical protein
VVTSRQDLRALSRPYLSSQVGDAADVMPQEADAIRVETTLDPIALEAHPSFRELTDLPRR